MPGGLYICFMKTTGNTILITGGTSGIGKALALAFAQRGNQIIILGRNPDKLQALQAQHPEFHTYCHELKNLEEAPGLIQQIVEEHPQLNILINNAGIQYNYQFLESNKVANYIRDEYTINLLAPAMLCYYLLPHLAQQNEAAIVQVSSGLALAPKPQAVVYCSSKAGLHSFSQGLRYQLENTSVKVFEVLPPLVDTPMTLERPGKKMSSEQLAELFIRNFRRNRYETYPGPVKYLKWMLRVAPGLAHRIMKQRK